MDELSGDLDVSGLVRAASINDFPSTRTWIERNKQHLLGQGKNRSFVRSQISKLVRAAALDGQVTNVEFLRFYG